MPDRPKQYRPPGSVRVDSLARPTARQRGYTAAWDRERIAHLNDSPLCVRCLPRVVQATVVDHKIPHRGDEALFWDRANWQSLCATCHNRKTATEDRQPRG